MNNNLLIYLCKLRSYDARFPSGIESNANDWRLAEENLSAHSVDLMYIRNSGAYRLIIEKIKALRSYLERGNPKLNALELLLKIVE